MQDFVLDEAAYPSRPPVLPAVEEGSTGEHWSEKFRNMEKYDWSDRKWLRKNKGKFAFLPIPLSLKSTSPQNTGYFMIVSPEDYERMTTYEDGSRKEWHVNVQRDKEGNIDKIYAMRRGKLGEPRSVPAHREVLGCLQESGDVDHMNGCGLDNRKGTLEDPANLILGPKSHNHYNNRQKRRVNTDILYRGVVKRGHDSEGRQLYGWISAKRLGRLLVKDEKTGKRVLKDVVEFYGRKMKPRLSQEEANAEYNRFIEEQSNGRTKWAHSPGTVNFPVFPPLMDSEPALSRERSRSREKMSKDVPF